MRLILNLSPKKGFPLLSAIPGANVREGMLSIYFFNCDRSFDPLVVAIIVSPEPFRLPPKDHPSYPFEPFGIAQHKV